MSFTTKNVARSDHGERYVEHAVQFETATANGITVSRDSKGAICPLCRELIKSGVSDQPWEAYYKDQKILSGSSIQGMSMLELIETDDGLRYIKYVPFPTKLKEQE